MKKEIIVALIAISMMLVTTTAMAVKPNMNQQIRLVEKDPSDWFTIDGGWGQININDNNGMFVFNGHELDAEVSYTLISFDEDWFGCVELGYDIADCDGNIHIMGSTDFVYNDYPVDDEGDYKDVTGAKIWLILTADWGTDAPNKWNPTEWLFETALVEMNTIE